MSDRRTANLVAEKTGSVPCMEEEIGEQFVLPTQHHGHGTFSDVMACMVDHPAAIRHAFKIFPYPGIVD